MTDRTNELRGVLRDLNDSIETLTKEAPDLTDVISILRRSAFKVEGPENIWREDMTSYQKACIAIDRGFDIERRHPNGILIRYLGYYLWGLTDPQIDTLKERVATIKRGETPKHIIQPGTNLCSTKS